MIKRVSRSQEQHAGRRHGVDPTTCDKEYTGADLEFMRAMEQYKKLSRRPFPTWSEALEVLISLGYRKVAAPCPLPGKKDSSTT